MSYENLNLSEAAQPKTEVLLSQHMNDETIALVRRRLIATGRSPNTIQGYASDWRTFRKWLSLQMESTEESGISPETPLDEAAAAWLADDDKASPNTVRRRKSSIRKFGTALNYRDMLETYLAPHKPPSKAHPLPGGMDDVRAILEHASSMEDYGLIVMLGFMGMRVDEAVSMKASEFEAVLHDPRVEIYGKGKKVRFVPVPESQRATMYALSCMSGELMLGGMANSTARRHVKEMAVRANIVGHKGLPVASHDLRASVATELYGQTGDIAMVQEFLGHSDSAITAGYIGINNKKMEAAVNLL